jgi:hypothetical protein
MLALDDPRLPMRSFLDAPGGFAWWYLDLRDDRGSGLVAIWSFGLPFLPGYASAERRGAPQRPGDRPSLNLAVYERGRLVFYQLAEHDPEDAAWDPARGIWRFGRSTITYARDASASARDGVAGTSAPGARLGSEPARSRLCLRLDCDVPASRARLRGEVEITGTACQPVAALGAGGAGAALAEAPGGAAPTHLWTPVIMPALGRARLDVDGEPLLQVTGRAYHDRNGGAVALHRLGIRHWLWGRAAMPDHEAIYYLLFPERSDARPLAYYLRLREDGVAEALPNAVARLSGPRLARFGMPWWSRIALEADDPSAPAGRARLEVRAGAPVDDGPFYLRQLVEARDASGASGPGFGELVRPARVDLPGQEPFVRMRVHRVAGSNSVFLPLFTGPKSGRLSRLLADLGARAKARATGGPAPRGAPTGEDARGAGAFGGGAS